MMVPDAYRSFLERKIKTAIAMGFTVDDSEINPLLKPHQCAIVRWAVQGGRRAIFAKFGLGKSVMQLEVLRLILARAGGRGLIVAPLGVRQEFMRDARMLGIDMRFIRSIDEAGAEGLYITNYETVRDGKLDPNEFTAASLDEASVLRSFGSKTYQTFLTLFDRVRFRFVATATPSPNRYKELIHYAGFLGIMDTGQALTRWFQRNSEQANDLTLFPHKEQEFWAWLHSWAIFLQRPSDLGFSDEGYDLPELVVRWHEVPSDIAAAGCERDGQGILFRAGAVGLASEAKERRDSLPARIAKLRELIEARPADHVVIWHDLEAERHAIATAVPGVVSVWGTQDLDEREAAIIDFSEGRIARLSTKPVIAGSGCNFQRHCAWAVFAGVSHKFNDFIQAVHRLHRFLQPRTVEIDIIHTETEREIVRDLQAKWARHNELADQMSEIIKKHGLNSLSMVEALTRSIGVERLEVSGQGWTVANNDCVDEARRMATDSVGLIVTSVPFSNHYEYTASYNDFGHTDDNHHFWEQMDHLTPELLRVLQPGRLACIHVKDRIVFGNVTGKGYPTVSPFHAEAIFHYMRHGFEYMGMHIILTDVVRENNQTNRLTYKELRKDGTKMGQGCPEYVLIFRKPQSDRSKGYADVRVPKSPEDYSLARWQVDAHAFWRSSGNRLLSVDELSKLGPDALAKLFTEQSLQTIYDFEAHVRIGEALAARGALPSSFMSLAPGSWSDSIWHDVNRMLTLNGEQSKRGLEMHVCPLQFDIVDRLIERYSNPGDEVFDPFGGLMTVPYRALRLKRRGRASELHTGYFLDGVKYLQAMEREVSMPSLFDLMETEAAPAKPKATPLAKPAARRRPTPPADSLLEVV
ncbi:DNA methyltransferase [Azospirillum brasilense]|uniref:DNA methyltransferase n=1 Tax=Azospirillum brasilense TaxID=192 RepID=UPI001EDA884D|nr:DNA methyltransferase [Azospirillum brasilense]UKJ74537.1 DNA methylase N-4 [Azospirillum brasilense]